MCLGCSPHRPRRDSQTPLRTYHNAPFHQLEQQAMRELKWVLQYYATFATLFWSSVIRRSIAMGFPAPSSIADYAAPHKHARMPCCSTAAQTTSKHRSLPEPWLPCVPLLYDVHYWQYIVTLASSPRRGVCPRPLLPSRNAMAERMESTRRHTGRHWQKESPDHSMPLRRSHAGALSSSKSVTCTCSFQVLRTIASLRSSNYPYHDQI